MTYLRISFSGMIGLVALVVTPTLSPDRTVPEVRVEGKSRIGLVQPAWGEEAWRQEIENICTKTDDSMTLSKDELQSLIERCDRLKPIIESLEETPRKVYRKRLQMCRELFAYVLKSKEQTK